MIGPFKKQPLSGVIHPFLRERGRFLSAVCGMEKGARGVYAEIFQSTALVNKHGIKFYCLYSFDVSGGALLRSL
jgi:hypothetical protein